MTVPIAYADERLRGDPGVERCLAGVLAMYATRGPAAVEALRPVLDPSFTFIPAGSEASALQETYRGPDGVARFLARQSALTADSWWPELQSIEVDADSIVVAVISRPRRIDGLQAEFAIEHVWTRRGDVLTGFRSHTAQQQEYDRFHAHTAEDLSGSG